MKVLYVDNTLGFGGAIKSLALTLRGLPAIDKLLVTSQDDEIVRLWFDGVSVRRYRRLVNYRTKDRIQNAIRQPTLRWLAMKAFALADVVVTFVNCIRLVWIIRREDVDLVHLNTGWSPPEAMRAARIAGVPYLVHLRGFQHDRRLLDAATARAVARVIVVSDAVGASLSGTPIDPAIITTVHDPVDGPLLTASAAARDRVRRDCALPPDAIAVGIFGRVVPWKGQLQFVLAASMAMRDNPAIHAVIVGDQSDGGVAYFDEVKACIAQSGVADRFVLTGYRENVEEYYAAMDIVVHASTSPEPFGMVVPEAMAAGRAVIAADAGGPREVITRGVDGLLVPPGDVDALAQAIGSLARDPALLHRLGTSGRETAVSRFSIAANAANVAREYSALFAQRPAPLRRARRS